MLVRGVKNSKSYNVGRDVDDDKESIENHKEGKINSELDDDAMDNDFEFIEDETLDNVNGAYDKELMLKEDINEKHGYVLRIGEGELSQNASRIEFAKGSSEEANKMLTGQTVANDSVILLPSSVSLAKPLIAKSVVHKKSELEASTSDGGDHQLPQSHFTSSNSTPSANKPVRKKMRCDMPPKTLTPIDEMQKLLVRHRARSRAMRPRWSSDRDQEILSAKLKIENPPILKNDQELYAPLFRNISMFKRSYELMERMLKIYVYKDGERPIFHRPILKGLYASEGWFMKLMEGSKRFSVKDPRKAHLFYMPYSSRSRMLEYTLYVRNSHNRTNLRQYLKDYTERIAAKYRFWNRTGGADHFLVACHDRAPYI